MSKHKPNRNGLSSDEIVRLLPVACSNEQAAVEFWERHRWGDAPCCARCDSRSVYMMSDMETRDRNKRHLWRCRACKRQYTVRIGTFLEESRIPLRHWCYATWRACMSEKGVSALEIKRQTGLSYKSALFLLHRIRFAMSNPDAEKLSGTIEADETYVGGSPRNRGKPGPCEERLRIDMDWEDAAERIVEKPPQDSEEESREEGDDKEADEPKPLV